MSRKGMIIAVGMGAAALAGGCGKGWHMDYGKPAAQFLQEDVASQGKAFLGEKVTIKGTVAEVDVRDSTRAWIYLEGGVACDLGKFRAMAQGCKTGDTVYVDGFLERCEKGDVLLSPAMLRDPTAPFSPEVSQGSASSAEGSSVGGTEGGKPEAKELPAGTPAIELYVDMALGLCDPEAAKERLERLGAGDLKAALNKEMEGLSSNLAGKRQVTAKQFTALVHGMKIVSSAQQTTVIGISQDRACLEVRLFLSSRYAYVVTVTTERAGLPRDVVEKLKQ